MTVTYGIDVAHWWSVDYDKLPDWVKVVSFKVTEGINLLDPTWEHNLNGCLRTGRIPIPYHFYRTAINPVSQANYFLEVTRPYWDVLKVRANDFEKSHTLPDGTWYNPRVSTIEADLKAYQTRLKESGWTAFDLLYTNLDTWNTYKLPNYKNLWQGPAWVHDVIDGLWLAWWPYARPTTEADLESFDIHEWNLSLPRPFKEYWMWQVASDFYLPGVFNSSGKPKGADFNIIPYSFEEVRDMLGIEDQPEEPEDPPEVPDFPEFDLINEKLDKISGMLEDIMAKLQPEEPEDPPEDDVRWLVTRTDKERIYLTHIVSYNSNGAPVFEFYPSDVAEVKNRVFVRGGDAVPVFPGSGITGDGGRIGWLVNKALLETMYGSAPIPEVDLYLDAKFLG